MANEYMKRAPNSLLISTSKFKPQRETSHIQQNGKIEKTDKPRVNKNVEQLHFWQKYKLVKPLWKTGSYLLKQNIYPMHDPAITLPSVYPKERNIYIIKKI